MRAFTLLLLLLAGCARQLPPVEVTATTDEAQLARGRYLAEAVMNCGGCHARRDWRFFSGPPVEGSEFAGSGDLARSEGFPEKFSFSAPNLTPHHLGTWADGEIARAIVFGQSKDGSGLFPYMPYFEYREALARDDLSALVAYLRSLPPAPWEPPGPRRFPMPGFVLNGFPEERPLRATAPRPGEPEYGRYLTEIAACMGCHTQADKRGSFTGPRYAGGREFKVPAPGAGVLRSRNLTPEPNTGLGLMTRQTFVALFRARSVELVRLQEVLPGETNSTMPWWAYARMRDEDLGAIYDYLRTLPPSAGQ